MVFYPYYVHVLPSSSSRLSLVEVMKSWLILRSFGHVQHDADGKAYYTFEFIAQAPTYTRHALSTICIGNGMKLIHSNVKIIMCVYVALILSWGCYISRQQTANACITVFSLCCNITSFLHGEQFSSREVLHFDNGGQREEVGEDERQIANRYWFLPNC